MACQKLIKQPISAANASLLQPRPYQLEMLDDSMKRNVIVVMDTGSGKTHVAVLRIQRELERCGSNQIVWFLAPKVALGEQQYNVLKQALPCYEQRFLCGADGVDKWTTQALWDAVLFNVRIVVSTPQVLLDVLTHGFFNLSRIALMVFDEAHNCTDKTPMNLIMKDFYFRSKRSKGTTPHVLGLTASPVRKFDPKLLDGIEANLDAITVTPKLHRSDLAKYANRPQTTAEWYNPNQRLPEPIMLTKLRGAVVSYDLLQDPYILKLKRLQDSETNSQLRKAILEQRTPCLSQLKALLLRAEELLQQLGPGAVEWYLNKCTERLTEIRCQDHHGLLINLRDSDMSHLQTLLVNCVGPDRSQIENSNGWLLSTKFDRLLQVLNREASKTFTGIIFAKQRATVAALSALLSVHTLTNTRFQVGSFVGSSVHLLKRTNISDLADGRAQQTFLDGFRSGDINLIVSTDVLEEGIDVPSCNLVVCFDPPMNLTSFVQRRGRARQHESKFIIFLPDESARIREWQSAEKLLMDIYAEEDRVLQAELSAEEIEEDAHQELYVESTGALLTLNNSVSHLHHFCNTLHIQHVNLKPTFIINEQEKSGVLSATVILPSSLDPKLRKAQSRHLWRSEKHAKQDAAFVAYEQLLNAGLVNEHLLPAVEPDVTGEHHQGTYVSSLVQVNTCFDPCVHLARRWHESPLNVIGNELVLNIPGGDDVSLLMVLPTPLPSSRSFWLYHEDEVSIEVTVKRTFKVEESQLDTFRRATRALFRAVFSNHNIATDLDFLVVFCPGIPFGHLTEWTAQALSRRSLPQDLDFMRGKLVYDKTRANVPCIFQGSRMDIASRERFKEHNHMDRDLHPQPELCAEIRRLPRPRNFLMPFPRELEHAYKRHNAFHIVPTRHCNTSGLSAETAMIACVANSVTRHFKSILIAEELRTTILETINFIPVDLIREAICAPSARESTNYERLEHLGDCVLKALTSLQFMAEYPLYPEEMLALMKDRVVSNNNLANAAIQLGIDRFIISDNPPMTKPQPLYINQVLAESIDSSTYRQLSMKRLADVVESLIGAAFLAGFENPALDRAYNNGRAFESGLEKAIDCLQVFLPSVKWKNIRTLKHQVFESAMPKEIFRSRCSQRLRSEQLDQVETLLGHCFKNKFILVSALTHPSYNTDMDQQTYNRLEFLGDALLDLVVTTQIFTKHKGLSHHRMHNIRHCTVNEHFLAYISMSRTIETERKDVKPPWESNGHNASAIQVWDSQHTLWEYMLRDLMAGSLTAALVTAAKIHLATQPWIESCLNTGNCFPWVELMSIGAPKCISDIMESTLTAAWLDDHDATVDDAFKTIEAILEQFGLLQTLHRLARDDVECVNPKGRVAELAKTEVVHYEIAPAREPSVDENSSGGDEDTILIIDGVELSRVPTPNVVNGEGVDQHTVSLINEYRLAEMAIATWYQPGAGADVVQAARERRAQETMGMDDEEGGVRVDSKDNEDVDEGDLVTGENRPTDCNAA